MYLVVFLPEWTKWSHWLQSRRWTGVQRPYRAGQPARVRAPRGICLSLKCFVCLQHRHRAFVMSPLKKKIKILKPPYHISSELNLYLSPPSHVYGWLLISEPILTWLSGWLSGDGSCRGSRCCTTRTRLSLREETPSSRPPWGTLRHAGSPS